MNKEEKQNESLQVDRFTIDDVLTTVKLKGMSKKELVKHIEILERKCLSLDNALVITIEQLNKKVRAIDGTLQ